MGVFIRAVNSSDATIDFLLSTKRDAAAAPAPRVINTDEHAGYPPAIVATHRRLQSRLLGPTLRTHTHNFAQPLSVL